MLMDLRLVPVLADGLREYFENEELFELCGLFDVSVDWIDNASGYMRLAKRLILEPEHGNNRRLMEALVPSLMARAREQQARTSYERQDHHRSMVERLKSLEADLEGGGLPTELSAPEDHQFTAKSKVREFLGLADTQITIVDNYVGVGTLDCLRDVQQPIRLLTGSGDRSIEPAFERALEGFRAEGFAIEVRRHRKLHDRYILFADRAWLVGSSLKDAGRKAFNAIECVDGKSAIVADVENKWSEAVPFPS
jgi:hypothetical protein